MKRHHRSRQRDAASGVSLVRLARFFFSSRRRHTRSSSSWRTRRLFNEAPLVAALAAANLRGRDQLEPGVGATGAASGVLADRLGFAQDLLIAHQAVDSDRARGQDHGDIEEQPGDRAVEAQLPHAGRDRNNATETAYEP